MTSAEIRAQYLNFFQSKGHRIVPSAPLVIKNDPTLMFTNAGMNQFKDYFLGNKPAPNSRIADTQKCLRVSGKHNDLEEVGLDTYHHTMFEMLGNWSFGDYFKKEALEWSWELLTKVYKLPAERIYITVFGGDEKEGLPVDTQALEIAKALAPEGHVLLGSKKDNFWEMGETGPCGPCSELHIDLRDEAEIALKPGVELVNNDHPQVVEIWNNVFMEFNRLANGSLVKLPAQHVDTGMGFERLCMAVQGKKSNYDTDVFQPTITYIANQCGIKYGDSEKTDIAMRVLADHIRAIAFTIADGQLPSNNKAGYVIRRILRRAVRYYYNFLGIKSPFLCTLVPLLADQFKDVFPELEQQKDFVGKVIQEEESSFLRTLEQGLNRLEDVLKLQSVKESKSIDGKLAFELYDTYGFPYDLTALIARENGLSVDEAGFASAMEEQKNRSRVASASSSGDWVTIGEEIPTQFLGYDVLETDSVITKYRAVSTKNKVVYQIVLDRTPFYAESGGQVGDTGKFVFNSGKELIIQDTKKENDLIIHLTDVNPAGIIDENGVNVNAIVSAERRQATSRNHTATHLLHSALKRVLGIHVNQKGSLVSPEVLRFDFSHFSKVEKLELKEIEAMTNQKVLENIRLQEERNLPLQEAIDRGATALFGEKYGDSVRLITFDKNYSMELCGGTHVSATGEIGLVKIVAESSVAAGVRRIEALTGQKALDYIAGQESLLAELSDLLKNPSNLKKSLESVLDEKQQILKDLEAYKAKETLSKIEELKGQVVDLGFYTTLFSNLGSMEAEQVKTISFELRKAYPNLVFVSGSHTAGKPHLSVMLGEEIDNSILNAVEVIKASAKLIQGGGGGQPFYATAGGKNVEGIQEAIEAAKAYVLEKIK